jgi:hypothetical protein
MWLLAWLKAIVIICVSVITSMYFFWCGGLAAMKALRSSTIFASIKPGLSPCAIAAPAPLIFLINRDLDVNWLTDATLNKCDDYSAEP